VFFKKVRDFSGQLISKSGFINTVNFNDFVFTAESRDNTDPGRTHPQPLGQEFDTGFISGSVYRW
jgi:hypothetical protein